MSFLYWLCMHTQSTLGIMWLKGQSSLTPVTKNDIVNIRSFSKKQSLSLVMLLISEQCHPIVLCLKHLIQWQNIASEWSLPFLSTNWRGRPVVFLARSVHLLVVLPHCSALNFGLYEELLEVWRNPSIKYVWWTEGFRHWHGKNYLIFSSLIIDAFVLFSVQATLNILSLHHILKASMWLLSFSSQLSEKAENTIVSTKWIFMLLHIALISGLVNGNSS